MAAALALIVLGLLLLVAGGETLLRGAVRLASLLRITPAVIGLTVVAAGTSVPELAVSALAAWRGSADIAVANVVGSNIFNLTIVLGIAALARPLILSGRTAHLEYPVLVLVTLMAMAVMQDLVVSRLDAVLFLAVYVAFTAYVVNLVGTQLSSEEARELGGEVSELAESAPHAWRSLALVAAGITLLGAGAQSTVIGAVDLARMIGWSERMIGLTIVATGTSLPEVVTSLVSLYRGRDDVAVGNAVGSSLFNLLVILGLSGAIAPLPVHAAVATSDGWWMLGLTCLLLPLVAVRRRIGRIEGAALLAGYVAYVAVLVTSQRG